ncbi:MAG: biotin/lipoyl-containing protein, partial [Trinickia sp.]|uniref:biotin/lipoyl-containing protein n=1 Tax=Trinickia sp. TaxID=2571163 RepID=UPI003F7D76B9
MSEAIEVKVPDIGDFKDIPVIDILVKPGDAVEKEQSLITLESDKATMDVPSPAAGTVKEIKVKQGDPVSEGTLIVVLEGGGAPATAKPAQGNGAAAPAAAPAAPARAAAPAAAGGQQEVKVPDIGDYKDVPVIEIAVKVGDRVEKEQSLITLESDKATMDVPSPAAGVVKAINVKVGDTVSEGVVILMLESESGAAAAAPAAQPAAPEPKNVEPLDSPRPAGPQSVPAHPSALAQAPSIPAGEGGSRQPSHASPSVRKFARELGVDVAQVRGSGPKGRITQDDVTAFVKGVMTGQRAPAGAAAPAAGGGELGLLPWPKIDFT